ncbi:hypothetical protein BGW80DRAFT_349657 [Lactifluus volemus]|nr:hypothetical protein BGW80DRAFT_349657 [Lactifluus volemus]
MRSMDVVVCQFPHMFDSDPIIPSGESKSVMLPQNVDSSHLSDGHYHWPFSIVPPTIVVSSPNSPSAESSLGPGHISSHGRGRDLKHQLVVTIYRRGRLNRNVGVTQQIRYVPPPDPSMPSCPSPSAIEAPHDFPVNSDWEPQEYPGVLVKGSFYGKSIEVVCKLIIPNSYPLGGPIPLASL